MTAAALLHKRRKLLLIILCVAFSAFMADILDLREELHLLSCPYSSLDNNITTGITSHCTFETETILVFFSAHQKSSTEITFLHLLPYNFRAPPSWS
jgi:hypothetical protein